MRDEGEPERGGRQRHLEGARGLARLQVLPLHGFGAFLPALVEGTAEARGWMDLVRLLPLALAGTLMGWLLCPGFDDLRLQAAALVPAGWLNGNGIEAPTVAAQ